MKILSRGVVTCALLVLTACAVVVPAPEEVPAKPPKMQISVPATAPEGATLLTGPPLQLVYPANLYRHGAVLPSHDGLGYLEALALWLEANPQPRWQFQVSAESAGGQIERRALAEKRRELLQRFFLRKGLPVEDWEWMAKVDEEVQLRLVVRPGTP